MANYIDRQVKESILDDMVELYTQANILSQNKKLGSVYKTNFNLYTE